VKSFYKGISAVFFVYSVDSLESFQELQSWSAEVKEYAHEEVVMFLVAAKSDIEA
jgi:GTPase SAR1 family protein